MIFPKVHVPGPIKFFQIYQLTNQNKQKFNCRACSDDPYAEWGTVICYLGVLLTIFCTPLAHFWSPLIGQVVNKKSLGTEFFLAYQKTQLHTCSLPGYSNVSISKKKLWKKLKSYCPPPSPSDFGIFPSVWSIAKGGKGGRWWARTCKKITFLKRDFFSAGPGNHSISKIMIQTKVPEEDKIQAVLKVKEFLVFVTGKVTKNGFPLEAS